MSVRELRSRNALLTHCDRAFILLAFLRVLVPRVKAIYSKAIKAGVPLGVAIAGCYLFLSWYAWNFVDRYTSDAWASDFCGFFMVASTIIYAAGGLLAVAYVRKGLERAIDAGRVAFVAVITAVITGGVLIGITAALTPVMGERPTGIISIVFKVAGMPLALLVPSIPGLFFAVQAGKFYYDWRSGKTSSGQGGDRT